MNQRTGFRCDQNGRTDNRRKGFQFINGKRRKAGLKNHAQSTGRGEQFMDYSRADQKYIIFPERIALSAADYTVGIDKRHDDLIGNVPVRRIVFGLIIIIQEYLKVILKCDGFTDSIQFFYHFYPTFYTIYFVLKIAIVLLI